MSDQLGEMLAALTALSKPRQNHHFDEDTIPHGHCVDPMRCDCECEGVCGREKRKVARAAARMLRANR